MFRDLYLDGKGLSGSKTMVKLGIPNAKETVQEALENADIAKFLAPNPETIKLLEELKSKFGNIDIITGSGKNIAEKKMEKLNIQKTLFNNMITADDGSKPDLTAYNIWLSKYPDLKSEQFLYIGDRSSSDYEAPKKLGIDAILVNQKEADSTVTCPQLKSLSELSTILL